MPNLAAPLSDKKIPIERSGMLDNNSGREGFLLGSLLDGRTFKTFLCNYYTKEMMDEDNGKGKLNTALFWEYDTRLGGVQYEFSKPISRCIPEYLEILK